MGTWLLVALGGAVGAPARYVVDGWVQDRVQQRGQQRGQQRVQYRHRSARVGSRDRVRGAGDPTVGGAGATVLPTGTLVVNVAGSLVLGVVAGLAIDHGLGDGPTTLLGPGLCGAFTTFSTFAYETVALLEEGAWREALRSVAANVVVSLAAAGLGLAATATL
ncbi:MAG: CrcB family protein [Acidimicrobiia bacterium]|nr:CrcB family protein [Acidimicrobiia bacterium]